MTQSISDKFTNAKSKIEGLGYKVDHVANGATIYAKPNGDVIQYNPQTDQWVRRAPVTSRRRARASRTLSSSCLARRRQVQYRGLITTGRS
jgi:hypothetical protein